MKVLNAKSDIWGILFLAACLIVALVSQRQGWGEYALSGHEFRQTQTALTIRTMQETGFRMDYETPVFGKPWSVPMEFPTYQFLVVQYSKLTGDEIAQAGRSVSVIAFLFGLVATFGIIRGLGFSVGASALVLAPVCLAPIYLFYSRTVLIEALAWSLSSWFLWATLRYHRGGNWRWLVTAMMAGVLAVLTKATTWAVFCLPWAFVYLREVFTHRAHWRPHVQKWVIAGTVLGAGILIVGWSWVSYADSVKALNPVGKFLMSDRLTAFNFGTFESRFEGATWATWWQYWTQSVAVPLVLLGGLVCSLCWKRSRVIMLVGALTFLLSQLIFSGLYFLHDYYFYANASFLLIGLGAGFGCWWDQARSWWMRGAVLAVMAGGLLLQHQAFQRTYLPAQTAPARPLDTLVQAVELLTESSDVLAAHSPDWNSSWPYYLDRRMLLIPNSEVYWRPEEMDQAISNLADESVPLLLMIGDARSRLRLLAKRVDQLELKPEPLFEWDNLVTVYARRDLYDAYATRLQEANFAQITLPLPIQLSAPDEREALTDLPQFDQARALDFTAHSGVLPHGISIVWSRERDVLLMHATSELFFAIPEGATHVSLRCWVNPDVYDQADFDGMNMKLLSLDDDERPTLVYSLWISPEAGPEIYELRVPLPNPRHQTLVLQALPGPSGSAAYDQGLLEYLKFD